MSKIEIINVSKQIKKKYVIKNITETFESGNIIGLKGINGSGKTMLMRLIAGLILPTEGKIIIDNKELHRDISFPDSIGVLLENPSFLDAYTGRQNLKLLADIKKTASENSISEILEKVGLDEAADIKYKKYSLGMKQRLGIAAAVFEKPDIVILDEPTNSLDDNGVEMVKQLVEEEKARGALVLISCHDYEVLSYLANVIYEIEDGSITGCKKKGDYNENQS